MPVFKEASFKRQRVRSKEHKSRESWESKGGEEGRERIPFCFSTEIVLIQYPCCMNFPYACVRSTISSHRAVRCSFFMACLRGRPTFLLNQPVFHKVGICSSERRACSFGHEVSTLQPKWVQSKPLPLVPNNCCQNQCFCMEKKQIMSNIKNSDYSPHIYEAMEVQI